MRSQSRLCPMRLVADVTTHAPMDGTVAAAAAAEAAASLSFRPCSPPPCTAASGLGPAIQTSTPIMSRPVPSTSSQARATLRCRRGRERRPSWSCSPEGLSSRGRSCWDRGGGGWDGSGCSWVGCAGKREAWGERRRRHERFWAAVVVEETKMEERTGRQTDRQTDRHTQTHTY
jgi:hypothetical protein